MRTIIVMLLLSVVSGCKDVPDVQDAYIFKSQNWTSDWVEELTTGDCPKQYNVYPCINSGEEMLLFIQYIRSVDFKGKTLGEVRKRIKELAANDQKN